MRFFAGLLLLAVAACSTRTATKDRVDATTADAPTVASPPSPPAPAPPPVFDDLGDEGKVALGPGLTLHVRPVGPALLFVTLEEPAKPTWKKVSVERRVLGREDSTQSDELAVMRGWRKTATRHSAEPGVTYAYRAKLDDSETWTPEANVRMPNPTAAPPKPRHAVANADGGFAVVVGWEADARAAAGFEVDWRDDDAKPWKLLAVVNPSDRRFVHNYRLPKKTSRYRVASFNAYGKSDFVETAFVTNPDVTPPPAKPPGPLPPCTKLPVVADPNASLPIASLPAPEGSELWSYPAEPGAGARSLYGKYKGCIRPMGTFSLQGDPMGARPWTGEEGFPILRGIEGAGLHVGASVGTFAFSNGRYTQVNDAQFCGTPEPDTPDMRMYPFVPKIVGPEVQNWRGPFEDCQRDSLTDEEQEKR